MSQANNKLKFTIFFLIILISIIFSSLGEKGLFKSLSLYRKIREIDSNIENLQIKNKETQKEIERLKNDDVYIEKLAKEELGLIREDEIIYVFK
jgi:cell division protein FtsB